MTVVIPKGGTSEVLGAPSRGRVWRACVDAQDHVGTRIATTSAAANNHWVTTAECVHHSVVRLLGHSRRHPVPGVGGTRARGAAHRKRDGDGVRAGRGRR